MATKTAKQRVTILSAFLRPKAKKFMTTPQVKEILECDHPDIGSRLWNLSNANLLMKKKIAKSASGHGKVTNQYTITPKGKKLVEAHQHLILSGDDLTETFLVNAPRGPGGIDPPRAYSHAALSAIEGISELVDNNEKLLTTLRAVYKQLGRAIDEFERNKTQTMPAIENKTEAQEV